MKEKLVVLFLLVLLAFLGLGIVLVRINVKDGNKYERKAMAQQSYDSKAIPYKRGDIVDANGIVLATSSRVYNLFISPRDILANEKKCYQVTLNALDACFDLNIDDIAAYINGHQKSQYYVIARHLTYDQVEVYNNYLEELKSKELPEGQERILPTGINFQDDYVRTYPNGTLACDVIGFVNRDKEGKYGLEEYYDEELSGEEGREFGYLNEDNLFARTVKPATDGNSLQSTIDANLQGICEKYIKEFADSHQNEYREGLGADNVGVIMMEVNTGNVLAMASYPNYDLNNPYDLEQWYSESEWASFQEDSEAMRDARDSVWKNFCISDTYEPGSTMKPFTVAAALDCGAITGNETYNCTGSRTIGDHKISCHNTYGDGLLTVKQCVEQSCNVGLMYIAEAMGKTNYCKYFHNFNFGLKTNVDLSGEARTDSLVHTIDSMGPTELATNSFGQGSNVTMIQMITAFCSLINGGNYYEPHMVSKIMSSDGSTVETISPRILKQTVSPTVSAKIREYCNGVVVNGTGKTARPAGYAIGGKTGTAEKGKRGSSDRVLSFMGYAPADNPQVAIYVVVDRPNVAVQGDAKFATGIVRNILTEALPYMKIYMTEELSEKEVQELNERQLAITTTYKERAAELAAEEETETVPESTSETEPVWRSFEKDSATGYLVDPTNGHYIDPETGFDLSLSLPEGTEF